MFLHEKYEYLANSWWKLVVALLLWWWLMCHEQSLMWINCLYSFIVSLIESNSLCEINSNYNLLWYGQPVFSCCWKLCFIVSWSQTSLTQHTGLLLTGGMESPYQYLLKFLFNLSHVCKMLTSCNSLTFFWNNSIDLILLVASFDDEKRLSLHLNGYESMWHQL